MALTEQTIIDRLEVLPDGSVQVRQANQILRDGAVVSAARTPERLSEAQQRIAAMIAAENATPAVEEAPAASDEPNATENLLLPDEPWPTNPEEPSSAG